MVAVTDPTGRVTRYEYDACGRRSAVVDPTGARTTIEYDADSRPVRCTFPTGEVGWTDYDECGRVSAHLHPRRRRYPAALRRRRTGRGGPRQRLRAPRRFPYDAAGQLVSATNGNGGVTRYDYDALGRAVTITDPLGDVTRREFDALNRCVAETDPLGRTTRAGYDAVGRQTWQEDPTGRRTEWTYDAAGRIVSVEVDGRAVSSIHWDPARPDRSTIADRTRPDGRVVSHTTVWNRRGQVVRRTRDERHPHVGATTPPDGVRR